ncbi:hypothetical protein PVAP13_6KG340500 [Panicum virgatum]|uniref:Uncharacterized protein n=1 Tax=Panicum virgatum TaxID=38727 RepID=A0A8T0RFN1_PANVG|nr:hypothetical protein PVAP13_6KG340500 [Panicum virgatum]
MAARMVLLTLAVVLLLAAAGERPVPVSGLELGPLDPAAEQHGGEGTMPVARGGGPSGAVEEDKAYIVGRPLFKVPPSSPCRAKASRC